MKRLLAMLLCVGLCFVLGLGTTGCSKKDKEKPKVDTTKTTDKKESKDVILTVTGPASAVSIKPDKSGTATIKIERGKDIKEVTMTVDVPATAKGVTAKFETEKMGATGKEAKLKIDVDKTATAGEHTLKVTATPDAGKANDISVMVKVEGDAAPPKKDTALSVTGPEEAVTVKQGEKESATLKVVVGKNLTKAAELKITVKDAKDKDVKDEDLKVTVAPAKLDKSDNAKVTIEAGKAAAVGEYTATITATSEGATAASTIVTIKVEKK